VVKMRKNYQTLYMKTEVCFVLAGNINFQYSSCLYDRWYQAVWIAEELQALCNVFSLKPY
jgi:hypothetical protein